MPLKIELKAKDKLVVNGAVFENVGANATLLFHNNSAILREKEILSDEDASTPASRVYFALQCAYMFPEKKQHYIDLFHGFLQDYIDACPSAGPIQDEINDAVEKGNIYKALRKTHKLIIHEQEVFEGLGKSMEQKLIDLTAPDIPHENKPDTETGTAE